jgi:hypothetical protein
MVKRRISPASHFWLLERLAGTHGVPPVLPRDLARHRSGALLEVGLAERYALPENALD